MLSRRLVRFELDRSCQPGRDAAVMHSDTNTTTLRAWGLLSGLIGNAAAWYES